MEHIAIAIDGPSGAGKSTLARMTAKHFGYIYVDTGAMYRTVGLYALRRGADTTDAKAVGELLPEIDVRTDYDGDGVQRMYLNGEDVSEKIRAPEVSMAASNVSALPAVRAFLTDTQRRMAREHDVVMDGRDIGTVVLPDAAVKIFLTASAAERARRRWLELRDKGVEATYEDVLRDIEIRDKNDSSRDIAPLKPAPDAVICDTTQRDLAGSFELIKAVIEESGKDGL